MDKLKKKIALEKLTDSAGFSTDEQALAEANSDVATELKLNRLLANVHYLYSPTPATIPPRDVMLAGVANRAENERSYYRRQSVMHTVRKSLPVAATVLVAVIAVMLGTIFGQSKIAWATLDGFLLEYKFEFDEHFSGTAVDPSDHPIIQIERTLADWNARHDQVGGAPLVEMEITRYGKTYETPKYECYLQFRLLSDSDDLLKSFTGAIAALGIMDKPEVFSDTWYYSEKSPQSFYSGRIVVINGKEYVYPTDFNSDELSDIRGLIFFSPDWEGEAYYAFYQLGGGERINLADVVVVRNLPDDQITITDVADGVDRQQFQLLSYTKYVSAQVSASEKGLDFDPVELLKAQYQQEKMMDMGGWHPINFRGYRLVVDLSGEQAAMVARLEAAVLDWAKNYPEVLPGNDAEMLLKSGTVEVEAQSVEWQVTFWREDKGLATELRDKLEQTGFEVKRMTLVVTTEEESKRNYYAPRMSHQGMASPNFNLFYRLLDGSDEHGVNPYYFTEILSAADRGAALDLSNRMEAAFEDWLESINIEDIDYCGVPPRFGKQAAKTLPGAENNAEIVTGVSISASVAVEHLETLKDALAELGAPEPRIHNRSDYGQQPKGFSARFTLVHGKQLRGIAEEDATSVFPAPELEAHLGLFAELEKVASEWVEDNESLVTEDSKPLQVKTRQFDYGELPVHFYINTSIRQQDSFDGLVQALKDVGALEPEVSEPQPTGIPVIMSGSDANSFYADQILGYRFSLPAISLYMSSEAEVWDMLTEEEIAAHRAIIQRMEDALATWNQQNPPDEGDTLVELATRDRYGLVYEAGLKSTRRDRAILESLAAAMDIEGVPEYHYGVAFNRSGMYSGRTSPPMERVNGSSLGFNLIPYIYWNGEMQKKITRDMRKDAQDKYNQATALVVEWRKSHPELNEFLRGETLVEPSLEMPLLPNNGNERSFQVIIWSNDEEYCKAVLAELEEKLSDVEGLPEIKVGHGGMSRGGS